MENFAPDIYRQRMAIEGIYKRDLSEYSLCELLVQLSELLGMTIVFGPIVMRQAEKHNVKCKGYEAIAIWAESGVSVYTWEDSCFFSVDIYSCKPFNADDVVAFFRTEFDCDKIAHRSL